MRASNWIVDTCIINLPAMLRSRPRLMFFAAFSLDLPTTARCILFQVINKAASAQRQRSNEPWNLSISDRSHFPLDRSFSLSPSSQHFLLVAEAMRDRHRDRFVVHLVRWGSVGASCVRVDLLDPNFASAYAMAAWCHCWRKINGWMIDRPREMAEGVRLARRAVELDKGDAVALTRSGHALAHLAGDMQGGIALVDKALVLNPNLAAAWFLGAFLRLWHGETDIAIEHFAHAMRLSPLDPELYRMQAGMAAASLLGAL